MMHCNDIEKCMENQSPKGMKKGLHLSGVIIQKLIWIRTIFEC